MHREKGGRVGHEEHKLMPSLFKSRKFWVAMLDLAVSMALYFVGKYAAPSVGGDINFVIGAIQPAFVMVIAGIAWEDAALKSSGNFNPDGQG